MHDTLKNVVRAVFLTIGAASNMCRLSIVVLLVLNFFKVVSAQSESPPVCPTSDKNPYPTFAEKAYPPNVATWNELAELPVNCHITLESPAKLTMALSGTFVYTGSIAEIASRLGAISKTKGLRYWSVTDRSWRELVSDAYALNSRDTNDIRADFTSQEVLSGETLYFAQNDTRSWGVNIYGIQVISSSPDHLVFRSYNSSPVRFGPVILFKSDDAQSVIFIRRVDDTTWTNFSLTVIKNSAFTAGKASLINRQAAYYRLLTGQVPDKDPPLATE